MSTVRVVNIIPGDRSDEGDLNWQPALAVNPVNPNEIVITADTPPPGNVGYFYSYDRGETWQVNFSEPGEQLEGSTGFGSSGELYWAIARPDPSGVVVAIVHLLRTPDPSTLAPFPEIETPRPDVDQPYVYAFTGVFGPDRLYVGYNDRSHKPRSATIDVCLDAQATAPVFDQVRLEHRPAYPLDGYEIRPVAHTDKTVYVAYKGWRSYHGGIATTDIVVARDDNWGSGGFNSLTDPDKKSGRLVATNIHIQTDDTMFNLGGQRLNNDLSIAVDPTDSDIVYLVWGDNEGPHYTLRVCRSTDRGNTWTKNLLMVDDANLACLAVNSDGRVGFMYQRLLPSNQWETHFRRTTDPSATNWDDIILARTATTGIVADYSRLIAVGKDFYGVFPAWNTPDPSNFPATPPTALNPNGAKFLRNTSKAAPWQILGSTSSGPGAVIPGSVDPFFYSVTDSPAPPTDLTATVR